MLCQRAGVVCSTSNTKPQGAKRRRSSSRPDTRHTTSLSEVTPVHEPSVSIKTSTSRSQSNVTPEPTINSIENQDLRDTTSSIEFARNVFGTESGDKLTSTSIIPGHAGTVASHDHVWSLQHLQLPSREIMQILIDKYFDGYHWYISLFHEQQFRQLADRILATSIWSRKDMSNVNVVLAVALLGLQVGLEDDSWSDLGRLNSLSVDGKILLHDLSTEIRLHLIDVLDDCALEAVQICLLFATFHVYHDSPSLAWSLTGMAVSVSYALGLQSSRSTTSDFILRQIQHRCWNHAMVADNFGSMIYGRPGSIDPTFSNVHELLDLDQRITDPSILTHPVYGLQNVPNTASFPNLKCKLYRIIRHALDRVRVRKQNNDLCGNEVEASIKGTRHVQELLTQIRASFPPLFEWDNWVHADPWKYAEDPVSGLPMRNQWRQLLLQAFMIQILYNAAVILTHRPLLEHKISSLGESKPSKYVLESIRISLNTAVQAALCISRIALQRIHSQFCVSFAFMHLFTAGVVLCMVPASQPLSDLSHQAKAGVVRIIRMSQDLRSKNRVARHTEKLLSELLKITLQREIDNALKAQSMPDTTQRSSSPLRETTKHRTETRVNPNAAPGIDAAGTSVENPQQPLWDVTPSTANVQPVPDQYGTAAMHQPNMDMGEEGGMFMPYQFPTSQWPFSGYNDMSFDAGGFDEMMFNLLPFENTRNASSGYQYQP
ncbi:hypothetical protein B0A52_07792 [Exophiala mesophila]|uniref:Xylanolytic transcriptional activator regulatory domain-containing protein n=1 Tax=Exophiala mesophila TaxID=212818 RepID=A0A438MV88_EXOME|nr:hypothetical protein B0A52_07792 [Exophiala mesophila]